MAVFKCKMCGGELNLIEDTNVCECEYCGTMQTVPSADNEKKMNLFNRANRLRFANEFDKAAGVFESIVAEFPEEAEAYWGLVLCKYGIEYVDDSATAKKVPTCHRTSYDGIFEDDNFQMALEYADPIANRVYREEAKEIDRLQKAILEVADKEEPFDVFICYKETAEDGQRTKDSVLAQDMYDALTAKGYKVFFSRLTLEDKLGQEYEPYIFAALNSAKVMLAVGTKYEYFNAIWVKNEWARFLELIKNDKSKVLIPCYCDIDAYDMPQEFKHLQGQDMGKVGFIQDLVRGVEKIIQLEKDADEIPVQVVQVASGPSVISLLERAELFLEDEDWDSAKEYCEKVLDIEPKNATAYLYQTCAHYCEQNVNDLATIEERFEDFDSFKKAYRFADNNMKTLLNEVVMKANMWRKKLEELHKEVEEQIKKEEEQRKKAEEQRRQAIKPELKEIRNYLNSANCYVHCSFGLIVGLKSDGSVVLYGDKYEDKYDVSEWRDIVSIECAPGLIVGLKSDGRVVVTGSIANDYDVSKWKNIVLIACDLDHIVGLKSDGSVLLAQTNFYDTFYFEIPDKCNVSKWRNIVSIECGSNLIVGLKSDGSVVLTGESADKFDVSEWRDIVSINYGYEDIVGLKSDGSVVVTGKSADKFDVSKWRDIVSIAFGSNLIVGLKSDGSVVLTGESADKFDVSEWRDIVSIACYKSYVVGLKSDGRVVATGKSADEYTVSNEDVVVVPGISADEYDVSKCRDIVSIACDHDAIGRLKIVGLKADGSVISIEHTGMENLDLKLFDNKNQLREMAEKRLDCKKTIEEQARLEEERIERCRSRNVCQNCGGEFKGLLIKKCIKCGRPKDY